MLAVIFEFEAIDGKRDDYLAFAATLNQEVETIDGFLSIERFESLARPGRYVSISYWRDEAAIRNWRNRQGHRDAQQAGRQSIFRDYRLRVTQVLRDYGMHDRTQAPADSRAMHDTLSS